MDYNDQITHRTVVSVPGGYRAPPDSTLAYVFFFTYQAWLTMDDL